MNIGEDEYLAHYGILRRSGRYPWGSGKTQSQRNKGFLDYLDEMKAQGLSETEIAKGIGLMVDGKVSTADIRNARTIARAEQKQADIAMAERLKAKGLSNVKIGERMGRNESYVRTLLAPGEKTKVSILEATSNMLRREVDKGGYIDVGAGVELWNGISKEKLKAAVSVLENEGYEIHRVQIDQVTGRNKTTTKVLTPPGTTYRDVVTNIEKIRQVREYSPDGGRNWNGPRPPLSVDAKRVAVRYAEQGGSEADGVIYLRPGVKDISLGNSRYAQVRIAVNGTHYLKGMAMYRDDLPEGVDLLFNTNKSFTGNKLDAMKPMKTIKEDGKDTGKVDMENPFGAVIKTGGQRGALNIVNEEGDWEKWSKNLPSQMLSKQSPKLAKAQLDMTSEQRRNELDRIMSLSNPSIRKKLLLSFAEDTDAAAVHLKAAAMPGQRSHVILPLDKLKDTEVYAPNYPNGTRVVLVRFPHGGKFEIPELVVNNRNPQGRKLIGTQAKDAIGINHKVAERLSGADFDGDTVLVIPNNQRKVKNAPALEKLKGFDPQREYPGYPGMKKMDAHTKSFQMGDVSNLITDMTIHGASDDELARAVRHSMVVIDAEKHGLNWRQSAIDNGIASLKRKYQGASNAGASTLISRASSRIDVRERKTWTPGKKGAIDPETGKKVYEETGRNYTRTKVNKRTGETKTETVWQMQESKKLAETDDAHTLSSGTVREKIYADHSNRLKAMANEARLASLNVTSIPYSPSARKTYAAEVKSLDEALTKALKNAPLERQAQILANAKLAMLKQANPDMTKDERKKAESMAITEARFRTGAGKDQIVISDNEWNAIQAGAVSPSKLSKILDHADLDRVKDLATPRSQIAMTPAKMTRARQMAEDGYTQAEIAEHLGVSLSTLKSNLNSEG